MDLAFQEDEPEMRYNEQTFGSDFSLSGTIGLYKDSMFNNTREIQDQATNNELDPVTPTGDEEEFATDCLSASNALNQLMQDQSHGTYSMPPLMKTPDHPSNGTLSQKLRAPMATAVLRLNSSFQEFPVPIFDRSQRSNVFNDSINNLDRSAASKVSDGNSEIWNCPLPFVPLGKRSVSNDLAMSLDHLDLSNRSMESCQRMTLPFESGPLPPPPPELNASAGPGSLDISQDFSDSTGLDLLLALREDPGGAQERDGPVSLPDPKRTGLMVAEPLIYKQGSFQKDDIGAPWPGNIVKSPNVLQAIYSEDDRSAKPRGANKDKTSIVMSSTRREWISQLNGQTAGVRGAVVASGSVLSAEDHTQNLRQVIVVAPAVEELQTVKPIFRVNVADMNKSVGNTLTGIAPLGLDSSPFRDLRNYALTKPTFSPFETGTMAFGTEEHPEIDSSQPMLMITQVQRSATGRIKCLATCSLSQHVSSIEWLSASELLIATGSDLSIIKAHNDTIRVRSKLPKMHSDHIREIELSNFNRGHCLSGGYDGKNDMVLYGDFHRVRCLLLFCCQHLSPFCEADSELQHMNFSSTAHSLGCHVVFVTDLERVIGDQISSRKESRNALYKPTSVVSSVKWNPALANLASATTDNGFLHIFDTRLGYNNKLATVIETGKQNLFTHAWADTYSTLLGYDDGALRLFDARRPDHCVVSFTDPFVNTIGDLAFDPQRRFFVSFGSPSFSVWRSQAQLAFTLWHRDPASVSPQQLQWDPYYKCSGSFMLTGGRQHGLFATTDAHGYIALYDVHTAEQAAVALDNSI